MVYGILANSKEKRKECGNLNKLLNNSTKLSVFSMPCIWFPVTQAAHTSAMSFSSRSRDDSDMSYQESLLLSGNHDNTRWVREGACAAACCCRAVASALTAS